MSDEIDDNSGRRRGHGSSRSGSRRSSSRSSSSRSHRSSGSSEQSSSGASSRRRSRSSSSKASDYYKIKRQNTFLKLIIVLMVIGLIGGAFYVRAFLNHAEQKYVNVQYKLDKTVAANAKREKDFERIEAQMASLVQGKVPGLNPITYDKVIEVDEKYVKSMIMSVTGKDDKRKYEFTLNLFNHFKNIMQPRVKIFLFDRTGLQIGLADLHYMKDEVLVPGEKRTVHGQFALHMDNREPAYYIAEAMWNHNWMKQGDEL